MAQKVRSAASYGGPNLSDGMWMEMGEYQQLAAFTSTSTPTIQAFKIVPQDTSSLDGLPGLTVGSSIYRLQGGQFCVVGATAMAAQTTLDLGIVVYRNFATLATQITNAGGALTSLSVSPVNTAMPSGQTFILTNAAGTAQTWTTSAAVAKGATSIPVTSTTPTGTNAVGNAIIGIVGNAIAFGWLHPTGTPAFACNQALLLPANAANAALVTTGDPYGSYLPEIPGDVVATYATSAGSVSVAACLFSTMVS